MNIKNVVTENITSALVNFTEKAIKENINFPYSCIYFLNE